jgi:hypothetical protein
MSDNESNRGKKDNTSPEHKPKHAVNNEKAPSGSLGTNSLKGPTPGGSGSFQSKAQTREGENTGPSKQPEAEKDNRPSFRKTGDKDVDAHFAKDHKMQANPPLDFNKAAAQEERAQQLAKKFKKDKDQDKGLGL